MKSFIAIVVLIMKNWKYVVEFVSILDRNLEKGVNEADLRRGLARLEKGFRDVKTIEEAADAAASINDSFRKLS